MCISYDPAISPLGIGLGLTLGHQDGWSSKFVVTELWRDTGCPSSGEQTGMWSRYSGMLYRHQKQRLYVYAATWRDFKKILC